MLFMSRMVSLSNFYKSRLLRQGKMLFLGKGISRRFNVTTTFQCYNDVSMLQHRTHDLKISIKNQKRKKHKSEAKFVSVTFNSINFINFAAVTPRTIKFPYCLQCNCFT